MTASLLPVTGGRAQGRGSLPVNRIIDVDLVAGVSSGWGGSVLGVQLGPRRVQADGPFLSNGPGLSPIPGEPTKPKASTHHATFV